MTCPLRMLMYLGNSTVMSFAAESEFAEIFVPKVANANENEAKKAAGRFVH